MEKRQMSLIQNILNDIKVIRILCDRVDATKQVCI